MTQGFSCSLSMTSERELAALQGVRGEEEAVAVAGELDLADVVAAAEEVVMEGPSKEKIRALPNQFVQDRTVLMAVVVIQVNVVQMVEVALPHLMGVMEMLQNLP